MMIGEDIWLLTGGTILASADHELQQADIVIQGDQIVEIGNKIDRSKYRFSRVESASGKLIVPGLINTHYHSHDRWDRGRFSPLPLEIWMSLYNPPTYGRGWTPDEIYLRTLLGGMELIRGGATAVLDDVHMGMQIDDQSIDAVMRAYEDLGLRADVGIAYTDIPGHETIPYLDDLLPSKYKTKGQVAARSRGDMLECWRVLSDRWSGRVRSVISVSGPQRCTVDFQQDAAELASEIERPLLTHVLETRIQAMSAYHFYGRSMVDHMNQIGILRDNTVVIHGVWLTPEEMDLIASTQAGISHNPSSNMKLGSGIAPVRAMLDQGIAVGLGTDNHNANDGCSMLDALKLGMLLSPLAVEDYKHWLTARDGLRMATEQGASLMGQGHKIGRLEARFKADFLVFDLSADAFFPLNDAAVHLALTSPSQALRDAYVDGTAVLRDGEIQTVDESEIRKEIKNRVESIQKKALGGTVDAAELEPYLVEAYHKCLNDPQTAAFRGQFNCCS